MGVVIIGEMLLSSPLWSAMNSGLYCQEMVKFDNAENSIDSYSPGVEVVFPIARAPMGQNMAIIGKFTLSIIKMAATSKMKLYS